MKNSILTLVFLLAGLNIYGQINMEDSTAQVVSYWEKGEKQNYTATFDMYKVEGKDTISKENWLTMSKLRFLKLMKSHIR